MEINAAVCDFDATGVAPQKKGDAAFGWGHIETACVALLKRAKDIRVAIWYLRACMIRRGLAGTADGVRVLADLLRTPLDELHPRALPDESPGDMLLIHLGWLGGPQFHHQLGSASLESREALLNGLVSDRAASIVGDRDFAARAVALAHEIHTGLTRIQQTVSSTGRSFDVAASLELLTTATARLLQPGNQQPATPPETPTASNDSPPTPSGRAGSAPATRREVKLAIDRIIEYFRVYEPSHPAPILLLRVQKMLGADFEEVMKELYSDSATLVAQLNRPKRPN
jgi:type VI secretion system protein ImpA